MPIVQDLKGIKNDLTQWKLAHPNARRPRYPGPLKVKIVEASKKHGIRAVAQTLSISRNLIKKWNTPPPPASKIQSEPADLPAFVELENLKVPALERIEITLPAGVIMRFSCDVPPLHIARLCKALGSSCL